MNDWSRQQITDSLGETIRDFDQAVDSLKDLPVSEACPLVGELETRLAAAEYVVEVHRLENVTVPGQPGGLTWKIWLLNRGEVLADTALAHVSLAECRSVLAVPTPVPTANGHGHAARYAAPALSHGHADATSYRNPHSDGYRYANGNAHANAATYSDANGDSNSAPHTNSAPEGYCHADTATYCDTDAKPNPNTSNRTG